MKVLLTFLFSLFFFVGISHALPVALQNHLSFSSSNSRRMNELLLNYSPSLYYGVGLTYLRLNHSEYFIPRLDFLLYRATNFQFFTSLGAGIENVNGSQFNARIAELVTVFSTPEFYDFF